MNKVNYFLRENAIGLIRRGVNEKVVGREIARCFITALLIECAAYPKPGLVDRLRHLREVSIFNFQAAAAALHFWFERAAALGYRRRFRGGEVGKCLEGAAREMLRVQSGGNTHLGALLLMMPLAFAAGWLREAKLWSEVRRLRRALGMVVARMGWRDSIHFLRAIAIASPGGLRPVGFLDVSREETYKEIERYKASLLEVFNSYRGKDMVVDELLDGYRLTFDICLPNLRRWFSETGSLEKACVNALLAVMSSRPDTHIIKRRSEYEARIVMDMARRVLAEGGVVTRRGTRMLFKLDEYMRSKDLRPGASADILDVALAIYLLGGHKIGRL